VHEIRVAACVLGSLVVALWLTTWQWHASPLTRGFSLTVATCVVALVVARATDPDTAAWIVAPFLCAALGIGAHVEAFVLRHQYVLCVLVASATLWTLMIA